MNIINILIFFISGTIALDTEWWKYTSIYEIVVSSFMDSDGNGIGDIKGIISKLDHFVDLGIETLYLTPFFESPMMDQGYDISDYYKIDSRYGTMADFEELISQMNSRGLKLMTELVINHSSDTHEWFQKSIDKIEPYDDFYVWRDPIGYNNSKPIPPNQWVSVFGGITWTWNEKRKQFYLHNFLKQQPDFNLRSELLRVQLKDIMEFWLNKGMAGFRLDAPLHFVEDLHLREDKQYDIAESLRFIHDYRIFLNEYNKKQNNFERFLTAETRQLSSGIRKYYGEEDYPILHFAFNYFYEFMYSSLTGGESAILIQYAFMGVPKGNIIVWVSESHDNPRTGDRLPIEFSNIITTIITILPGISNYYYGQEIGMTGTYTRRDQIVDISGKGTRDGCRLPMQWDDTMNAGFSRKIGIPLPTSPDYFRSNVEHQRNQNISNYQMLKTLLQLRKTPTFKYGDFKHQIYSEQVHVFWRTYEGHDSYILLVNFRSDSSKVTINQVDRNFSPVRVVAASVNSQYQQGYELSRNQTFLMRPLSSIVLVTINTNT